MCKLRLSNFGASPAICKKACLDCKRKLTGHTMRPFQGSPLKGSRISDCRQLRSLLLARKRVASCDVLLINAFRLKPLHKLLPPKEQLFVLKLLLHALRWHLVCCFRGLVAEAPRSLRGKVGKSAGLSLKRWARQFGTHEVSGLSRRPAAQRGLRSWLRLVALSAKTSLCKAARDIASVELSLPLRRGRHSDRSKGGADLAYETLLCFWLPAHPADSVTPLPGPA